VAPPTFRFERLLPHKTKAEAASIIHRWIAAEDGRVKEARPPNFIKVAHGRKLTAKGWAPGAPKIIEFVLVATGGGVHVKATAYPAFGYVDEVRERPELARQNYGLALASLWGLFSPSLPQEAVAQPVLAADWPKQLADAERLVTNGEAALAVGAVIVFLALALIFSEIAGGLTVGHLLLLIPGHLLLGYGFRWRGAGVEQRRRAQQALRASGTSGEAHRLTPTARRP